MKVLTQNLTIENQKFVLIQGTAPDGKTYFGTVPYTEIGDDGRVKRTLNGFQMCTSIESAQEAIMSRKRKIVLDRIIKKLMKSGMQFDDALLAAFKTDEYKQNCK